MDMEASPEHVRSHMRSHCSEHCSEHPESSFSAETLGSGAGVAGFPDHLAEAD